MININLSRFLKALIAWADLMSGLLIAIYEGMSPHDRAKLRLALMELKGAEAEIEAQLGPDPDGNG